MLTAIDRARGRLPLAVRADAPELLDQGGLEPSEIEANLEDLARLNGLPGGTDASVAAIRHLVEDGEARILDVGTGRGDLPLAFAGRGWTTLGLDTNPDVLAVARRETAREASVEIVGGEDRSLPFDDGAFEVAHCSLLVHHLDPAAAVALLRQMGRVARRGVVVNDLRRGVLPLIATGVSVALLGRCRTTRHDGLASARRAYTLDELDRLLADAGLAVRWRSTPWMPRVVTAAVPAT